MIVIYSVVTLLSLYLIIDDLSYRGDKFDGLVAGLFTPVAVLVVLGLVANIVYLRTLRQGWWWAGSIPVTALLLGLMWMGI